MQELALRAALVRSGAGPNDARDVLGAPGEQACVDVARRLSLLSVSHNFSLPYFLGVFLRSVWDVEGVTSFALLPTGPALGVTRLCVFHMVLL